MIVKIVAEYSVCSNIYNSVCVACLLLALCDIFTINGNKTLQSKILTNESSLGSWRVQQMALYDRVIFIIITFYCQKRAITSPPAPKKSAEMRPQSSRLMSVLSCVIRSSKERTVRLLINLESSAINLHCLQHGVCVIGRCCSCCCSCLLRCISCAPSIHFMRRRLNWKSAAENFLCVQRSTGISLNNEHTITAN